MHVHHFLLVYISQQTCIMKKILQSTANEQQYVPHILKVNIYLC